MERRSQNLMNSWLRQGLTLGCVLLLAGMGTAALAQGPVAPSPNQAPQAQNLPPQQLG